MERFTVTVSPVEGAGLDLAELSLLANELRDSIGDLGVWERQPTLTNRGIDALIMVLNTAASLATIVDVVDRWRAGHPRRHLLAVVVDHLRTSAPGRAAPDRTVRARKALIVANATYSDRKLRRLRSPASDARALGSVLADPAIGGFTVDRVLDGDERTVRRRIADLFAGAERDDLLILHFSGHGVKDTRGRLHLAVADTEAAKLAATAVSVSFVADLMAETRSQQVVLILDCCYSGAFAADASARSDRSVHLADQFPGVGHIVLTASSAIEYAFEDGQLASPDSDPQPSVFTSALVTGLRTGEADLDGDGEISVDELYHYASLQVRASNPQQTPMKWTFGMSGSVVIANSARPAVLPKSIQDDLASDRISLRRVAVDDLRKLLTDVRPAMRAAAREALISLRDKDDSTQVREYAAAALGHAPPTPHPDVTARPVPAGPVDEPALDPEDGQQADPIDAGHARLNAPIKRRRRRLLISAAVVTVVISVALSTYLATLWLNGGRVTYTPIGLPAGSSEQSPAIKLTTGVKTVGGVSFDTSRTVKTRCEESEPNLPLSIVLSDLSISRPKSVHLLIAAGYGGEKYRNAAIGKITLEFGAAERTIVTDLVLGRNIRDWSADYPDVVRTFESETIREGILSRPPDGPHGRIDILRIDVPSRLSQGPLNRIVIEDLGYSYHDPCIIVWGVTVQSG